MFSNESWYQYLDESIKGLVDESYYLLDRESLYSEDLHDYSFVVFPMGKAYEGFLKKFLFDLKLISTKQYYGKHFRIGRSLNPSLPVKYRNGSWLVEKVNEMCGEVESGVYLSAHIWKAWQKGRNKLFHFFPNYREFITLSEAEARVEMIRKVMEECVSCGVKKGVFDKQ